MKFLSININENGLHCSVSKGNFEIVRLLLEMKIFDINAKSIMK